MPYMYYIYIYMCVYIYSVYSVYIYIYDREGWYFEHCVVVNSLIIRRGC